MTRLSPAQIAGHARAAGWSGEALVTAVAVALGESGGRTDARGDTTLQTGTWGPSIGLWQIRSLKSQRGTGGVRDELANLDPGVNARHAHRIYTDAGGFGPWTVYNIGAYRLHLGRARAGVNAAGPTPTSTTATAAPPGGWNPSLPDPGDAAYLWQRARDAPSPLDVAKAALALPIKTLAWVSDRNNLVRAAAVIVGTGLLLGAAWNLARPVTEQAQSLISKGRI